MRRRNSPQPYRKAPARSWFPPTSYPLAKRWISEAAPTREAAARDPAAAETLRRAAEEAGARYAAERDRDVRDRGLRAYLLEFHWKFAVPAGCLVFAFFAWPVGLSARRSGRSVGFAIGLFVSIAYWGLLVAGRTFGVRLNVPPAAAMWLPDAVVLGAGLVVAVARPGGRR